MQRAGFFLLSFFIVFIRTTIFATEKPLFIQPDSPRVSNSHRLPNACDLDSIRASLTRAGNIELKGMDNSCSLYFINPQILSGPAAQAYAETFGANLISIQSAAENTALGIALDSAHYGGEVIWIGFGDQKTEGTFEWYDGSEVVYTNWKQGEPNDAGDEDCTQIFTDGSWNDLNCDKYNSLSVIEVSLCPVTSIKPLKTIICEGETLELTTKTILGAPAYSYSWVSSPAGFTSTEQNPKVSPTVTTTYSVTSTDRYGCVSYGSITIIVNSLTPKITASGPTNFCTGDSVILSASTAAAYEWSTGQTTQAITVYTTGNYSVKITNGVCVGTVQQQVTVYPSPIAAFKNTTECLGNATTFTDQSTGALLWGWDFGDGSTPVLAQNPKHTYTKAGVYKVTLGIAGPGNCADTIQQSVVVHDKPLVAFSTTNECANDSIYFINQTTSDPSTNILGYLYDFGDGTSSTLENTAHLYAKAGNYKVTLKAVTADGCMGTATNTVTVRDIPVARFKAPNVCDGKKVIFTDLSTVGGSSAIKSWKWDFGDGSTDTVTSPQHLYASVNQYTATLKVISNYGCADSVTKLITINPNPLIDFTAADTAGCNPFKTNFQNQSTISSGKIVKWLWEFGSITAKSDLKDPPPFTFKNTSNTTLTSYTIKLTATSDSGCVTTLSKANYITVFPEPLAAFTVDPKETFVTNPIISFKNLSIGADTCAWAFDSLGASDLFNPPPYSFVDTGSYQITLIASNSYGCSDTTYRQVFIEPDYVLYVPNAFTPNGDEVNDTFGAKGSFIKDYHMTIFDRWGNVMYETEDMNLPWNGGIKGGSKLAEEAVYVYVIQIKGTNKRTYSYKGVVAVIR